MKNNTDNSLRIKRMTFIALFCALAFIVSLIFPIKVMFLTLDFKDCIMAICGMFFGPVAGICTAVIVPFIELLTSDTGIYGLIMNILSSVSFVGISSLIYKYKKTLFGAVAGLLAAVPVMTLIMIGANLIITPLYMPGADVHTVIGLIPTLLLPFNIIKGVLNAGFVMLLYKPFSTVLKKSGVRKTTGIDSDGKTTYFNKKRTLIVTAVSIAVMAIAFAVLFLVLQKLSTEISSSIPIGMVVSPEIITFTSNTTKTAMEIADAVKINFVGPLLRLIFGIALHFPTVYLIRNKVNVK